MVDSPDVLEESFQELQERSHSESEGQAVTVSLAVLQRVWY